ncbi:MAG: DUF4254 domain-containing protein [bacterium]|nr:DUF4254 domain-containing protein [bacterium]
MFNFKIIAKIFSNFVKNPCGEFKYKEKIEYLVWLSIKTNHTLWDLEDLARLPELGDKHVSGTKKEIDRNNQIRNDLIKDIDMEIIKEFDVSTGPQEKFYSESPGMIIDRLAIIFIKLSVIKKLISVIKEEDLKQDYINKGKLISGQMENLGNFLDLYLIRIKNGKAIFEIQQPIKIYNDERVKKYIRIIKQDHR